MSAAAGSAGDDAGRSSFPTPVGALGSMGDGPAVGETCDYCGSTALRWRKCKLICESCAQINKSCADL
ncbi:MAG: hypothetical protein ACO3F5_03310 [Gemmatimonadaceae bacterium]